MCVVHIKARKKKFIARTVIRTCKFIVRCLEIKSFQTCLVYCIHFIISCCKITEFISAYFGNRIIFFDFFNCLQNGFYSEIWCKSCHEHNHNCLYYAHYTNYYKLAVKMMEGGVFFSGSESFQFIKAFLHIGADYFLLSVVFIIEYHSCCFPHFLIGRQLFILADEFNSFKDIRIFCNTLCIYNKTHSVIFLIHKLNGSIPCFLELLQCISGFKISWHFFYCFFTALSFKCFLEVFCHKAFITVNSESLYIFRKVIWSIHQFVCGFFHICMFLSCVRKAEKCCCKHIYRDHCKYENDHCYNYQP